MSDDINLIISEKSTTKKRQLFAIGQTNPNQISYKRRKIVKVKSKPTLKTKPVKIKTDSEQIDELLSLFSDVNPYYIYNSIYVKVKNKVKKDPFVLNKTHIKIICPLVNTNPEQFYAYYMLLYKSGTFIDWQIILGSYDLKGPLFNFQPSKQHFKFKYKHLQSNQTLYNAMDDLFYTNQWLRWQFKRIVISYLIKKSRKRIIGAESDLVTGEPIAIDDQIKITSTKNRTMYVFSGNVLLKTARTCLEGQVASIPHVKVPHNPYTNTPFSLGELIQIYAKVVAYCGQKAKPFPSILSLYRECKFQHHLLLRVNHNYLQLRASENYILNDDSRGDFFIETIQSLMEDFEEPLALEFDSRLISYQRFRLWLRIEPAHHLLMSWKQLAADYWYYKQTEFLARVHWVNELSILTDIIILLKASYYKLQDVLKMYEAFRQHE